MKFIKTINWTLINFDEISKINYENCEKNHDIYYGYFYLKNGDKMDIYEYPDNFSVDDEKEYYFCAACCMKINEIILKRALAMQDNSILDICEIEDEIWLEFIEWVRPNINSLSKKIK